MPLGRLGIYLSACPNFRDEPDLRITDRTRSAAKSYFGFTTASE